MSKYQLGTLLSRFIILENALSERLTGANSGGQDKHFCEPLYEASIFHPSKLTSIPPRLVTASTKNRESFSFRRFEISNIGFLTPVEVSA
jgi:hypothetical protein